MDFQDRKEMVVLHLAGPALPWSDQSSPGTDSLEACLGLQKLYCSACRPMASLDPALLFHADIMQRDQIGPIMNLLQVRRSLRGSTPQADLATTRLPMPS